VARFLRFPSPEFVTVMRHAKTIEPEQDQRRCPRQRVSWLVTVAAGVAFPGLG